MQKNIQYGGKNIAYQRSGSGPALVLLHGFLESKAIWDEFSAELQNDFTVLAIDLPGHGDSEVLAATHSMHLMAETVKAVIQSENIDSVVIAGHSMGGYVALQFAAENEAMVEGVVLFHSHAGADSEQARENRLRTIEIVKQNRGGFIRQFIPDLFDQRHVGNYADAIRKLQDMASLMTSDAIIAALSGMRDRTGQLDFLTRTRIPVLFIIGKQDSRMPFSQLLQQAEAPSHSEILLLDHVGHMGYIESPAKTLQALSHFAARCFGR